MLYWRRVVKKRPVSLTDEEWHNLHVAGLTWDPQFMPRDGLVEPPFRAVTVLCHWCRERHCPSEVESCMALRKKDAVTTQRGSSKSTVTPGELLKPFPELWQFLTAHSFPDGQKRQTGRLSLSCGSDGLKMTLNDDETGEYCTKVGNSLDDLLLEFEAGLEPPTLPWRPSQYSDGKRKKSS